MRLVGQHDPVAVEAWTLSSERSEVERENIAAAGIQLPALDPRWQLASHAYSQLQEGPLTPDQRSRLIDQAATMGMRTFDASLIIAIAQDHARNGRPIQTRPPRSICPDGTRPGPRTAGRSRGVRGGDRGPHAAVDRRLINRRNGSPPDRHHHAPRSPER